MTSGGACAVCARAASEAARPSAERWARWVTGLFWIYIPTSTAALFLGQPAEGDVATVVDDVKMTVLVSIGVAFCIWIHRTTRWLQYRARLEFKPSAWFWFFVPFANVWKPLQVVSGLWCARTRLTEPPMLFHVWWGCWLMPNMFYAFQGEMQERAIKQGLAASASLAHVLIELVGILGAYFAIRVVREVSGLADDAVQRDAQTAH
jgi:hypothetical protein